MNNKKKKHYIKNDRIFRLENNNKNFKLAPHNALKKVFIQRFLVFSLSRGFQLTKTKKTRVKLAGIAFN